MSSQFLQETHIPKVIYQRQGSAMEETLPDWLSAQYIDLHERAINYQTHVVTESDIGQPDGIAHKYYGDSQWWWLLCSYNGIVNPATDMYAGQRVRVPALHQAQMALQSVPNVRREDLRGRTVRI